MRRYRYTRARNAFVIVAAFMLSLLVPGFAGKAAAEAICLPDLVYDDYNSAYPTPKVYLLTNCGAGTTVLASTPNGAAYAPRWSPDRKSVVLSMEVPGENENLFVADVQTGTLSEVTHLPGKELYADWSADGQELAFFYQQQPTDTLPAAFGVYNVRLDTKAVTPVTDTLFFGCCFGLARSPDGSRIALAVTLNNSSYGIDLIDADGTNQTVLIDTGQDLVRYLDWSPDGRYLIIGRETAAVGTDLWAVEVATGQATQLTNTQPGTFGFGVADDWSLFSFGALHINAATESGIYSLPLGDPSSATIVATPQTIGAVDVARSGVVQPAPPGFPLAAGTNPPPPPPPSPLPGAIALDLGDSYAAGEGAPGKKGYLPGTDVPQDRCHRSREAAGQVAWKKTGSSDVLGFHACSGAVIEDFFTPYPRNHVDKNGNPINPDERKAQLDWIGPSTKTITFMVGGNNAFFADVMEYCAWRSLLSQQKCEEVWGSAVDSAIRNLSTGTGSDHDNIPDLYQAIAAKAPGAKVVVRGYPRFFPKDRKAACFTGIPDRFFVASDMSWINGMIAELNKVIADNATKYGFTYADMYDALDGHELCTKKPWINNARLPKEASFHPNELGQREMGRILAPALRNG